MTVYGPFSPFQQLVHIHFPGSTGNIPSFKYYDIAYTLTWADDNPPAQPAVAQLISIDNPEIASSRAFAYGVSGGSTTLSLTQITGDVALALYDEQANFGGLISALNSGLGEGETVFWGSFTAVAYFTDGSEIHIASPISPTVGIPSPSTDADGTGGALYHAYEGAGNPLNELKFLYPGDTYFGVLIGVSTDFTPVSKTNPGGPSGNTGVNGFFSTDTLLGWPLPHLIS